VDYCFECPEYPCKRYDGIDAHDSLISHRNQKKDLAKAREIGIEAYLAEQREKKRLLTKLLRDYDDGGKDVFYCLAVNMLDPEDVRGVLETADAQCSALPPERKAVYMERSLREIATEKDIPLVLRPW